MTTTTRNEAGERLRVALFDESDEKGNHLNLDDRRALLDEALAAERRATVERLKTAVKTSLAARGTRDSADYWQGYADVLDLLERQVPE